MAPFAGFRHGTRRNGLRLGKPLHSSALVLRIKHARGGRTDREAPVSRLQVFCDPALLDETWIANKGWNPEKSASERAEFSREEMAYRLFDESAGTKFLGSRCLCAWMRGCARGRFGLRRRRAHDNQSDPAAGTA
jgi:hypothetical protein